jgi:hypothetical protein
MWEDVIEHPFPGDGHCIHCPSFLVWDWRDKCLQFVIQTGGKQIYQGAIPYKKLLDVTPIPYSLEHGIEIMHPLLDSDCLGHVSLSTLSGDCRIATEFLCIEDTEKRSELPFDSEDKPPLSYCLWLSTETVFESLLGSVSMTIELPSFPEDVCVLLNDNLPTPLTLFSRLARHPILLGRRLCKESVWNLGSPRGTPVKRLDLCNHH